MKARNARRLSLGFQWDAGSWDAVALACEWLFVKLGSARVHWNLPAFPPDIHSRKRAGFLKAFKNRLESAGDAVTAMGFAGACHPLLNLDELEKELAWGVKNPWNTGIADVLDLKPQALIPPLPDLLRPEAWKLYAAYGFSLVGCVGAPAARPLGSTAPRRRASSASPIFPCARLSVASAGPNDPLTRSFRRCVAAGPYSFFLLDLSGLQGTEVLRWVLEQPAAAMLSERAHLALVDPIGQADPTPARGPAAAGAGWRADWSRFPGPVLRAKIEEAAALSRRKRKKAEEYARLLSLLAPGLASGQPAADVKGRPAHAQRLVAHMLGDVTLAGTGFDVRLAGGRFSGIARSGVDVLPRRPAQSYLKAGGRILPWKTLSSFSFEGDNGTGLRETLGWEAADGPLGSIEYAFLDDSPQLTVSADLCFQPPPGIRVIEEYVPLAIAIAELPRGGGARIDAAAPDGSASSVVLTECNGWVPVPGAVHRIACAGGQQLVLRSAPREARRWGVPLFRVSRSRGARLLEVNPFGAFGVLPVDVLQGRRERISLLVDLEPPTEASADPGGPT
jgi:hypothetical protein